MNTNDDDKLSMNGLKICSVCLQSMGDYNNILVNVCGHLMHDTCYLNWDKFKSKKV